MRKGDLLSKTTRKNATKRRRDWTRPLEDQYYRPAHQTGDDDMIKLTGLWKNKSKDGKPYLAGSIGNLRLLVFPNDKMKDTDPDYRVCIAENEKKADAPKPAPKAEEDFPF